MAPLGSIAAFRRWQQDLKAALDPRRKVVTICGGTGCGAFGSADVADAFERELHRRGLTDRVALKRTGCHGFCEQGPVVVILPERIFYPGVQVDHVPEIVEQTVLGGKAIRRLLYVDPATGRRINRDHDVPFYARQRREVFRLNGVIDPTDLPDYVAHDGYAAAAKALAEMTPEQVIAEVTDAGLRGRGGAGFPTGRKWQLARQAPGEPKYLVCNADEGDPGAFMDRSLLEGTPHLILEGMIIGAYAIGASRGVIYVRAEYPLAVRNAGIAIRQARETGLLGANILGTGLDFDVDIQMGAGAFVCGEETALIASLEGKRGMPRPRPPFPAQSGYHSRPTNINNVETFANVPLIVLRGKDWYRGIGTEGSKGTKIFALAGKVRNTGLVEVPMGATLRQIIYDIGGGIPRGRKFKGAQMGGPSGGCVPARYLDLPIDYDSVKQVGAIMGSGGLIVMDEATCMVDIARFFTDFCQKESCGKCAPCRVGTRRMLEILTRITQGQGEMEDIDRLQELGEMIKEASLCGLGQTAPNPVLSTLRHFRDEYEAHIRLKRCPSHACEALAPTACASACPAHVNVPQYVALIGEGRFADALDVIRRRNPFASVCGRACHHPCEMFCRRGDVDEPVAIRHLKRFVSDRTKDVGTPPQWQGPRRGRVAVIGAGPAGLAAAYFLALAGREVKVFEALPVAGGMLAVGVPPYRLPRAALARDIEYIRRAGVEIQTNSRVGSLQELRQAGYDAVFIATGAHAGMKLDVPGAAGEGVQDAIAFLRRVALGELKELSGRVAVIGGGNAAIDAARAALRLGAQSVTILYRRTRDEMPALREEIEDAILEGVDIRYLVAPVEVLGDGRVRAVRCQEMELGPADESGRRRPVPKPGSEVTIECDHVLVAIGQSPELEFATSDGQLVVTKGRVQVDPVTQKAGDGLFVGGDAATGPATIVEAVAAGQRAAQAIDVFLGGKGELPPDTGLASPGKPEESQAQVGRRPIRARPPAKCRGNFDEVIKGYSLQAACAEARRCLRCDLE
ncbi:MAG: FAD-dependent oxidoreductase [Planctomycetota bacterium]|nr:FAD-dependent oxidoreductase [Planctomycetota bacterium]